MKRLIFLLLIVVVIASLSACNRQVLDFTYKFDEAYIWLSDGTFVHGNVQSWKDYEDGDQIQVKIDGVTYLTHAQNVILIAK